MRIDRVFLALGCFILIGCNCVSARFTVLTQKSPVVAAVGEMAVFTCRASNFNELTEVRWIRTQADRRYIINIFRDGSDQQKCELPEYIGRMEVMKGELARGGVALKLFNVSVADEGVYRCYLETLYYFAFGDLELRVTALGSDPRIEIESLQEDRILAVCRSDGWYPKPTVLVKEDDGWMKALNTSGVTLQQQGNLFSVAYPHVITEASNRAFSCLLRTPYHSERMSSLYVADLVFRKTPPPRSHNILLAGFGSILSLALGAVGALYCSRRSRKNTTGDLEWVPLAQKEREAGRKLKPCSKCLENELTDNDATSEEALKRIALKKQEPIKETTGPDEIIAKLKKEMEVNIALALKWQKEPIKETTVLDKIVTELRNEMKANAELSLKWQKALKELDKAIEALERELGFCKAKRNITIAAQEQDDRHDSYKAHLRFLLLPAKQNETSPSRPGNKKTGTVDHAELPKELCATCTRRYNRVDVNDGPCDPAAST